MKRNPPAATVFSWLRANLGHRCLAPLTGSDTRALSAAVQIIEQYSYDSDETVLQAFALVVQRMQPSTQELAYHAIAHVMEWGDRDRLWMLAGLEMFSQVRRCAWEPGGSARTTTTAII